jgi:hypothetical protein
MRNTRLSLTLVCLLLPRLAEASLILNQAGIADGFSLSTFASGFPLSDPSVIGCACGATAVAVTSGGNVLVADFLGNAYLFSDSDGQNISDALNVVTDFSPYC